MAIKISSFEDFEKKFEQRKHQSDIFAFFLFDDRPSHDAIEKFARSEFEWLDGLASTARIFFFIFIKDDAVKGRIVNPSLEVGRMFGVKPNQLPGVVLFTLKGKSDEVSEGVYFPFNAKLFTSNLTHVEEVFSDLFTLIQECREKSKSSKELLDSLKAEVSTLIRKEKLRPISNYLSETFSAIANIPKNLIQDVSKAFANEAARRALGG